MRRKSIYTSNCPGTILKFRFVTNLPGNIKTRKYLPLEMHKHDFAHHYKQENVYIDKKFRLCRKSKRNREFGNDCSFMFSLLFKVVHVQYRQNDSHL